MAVRPKELEESITRIPSVDAARVVGDTDRIREVHVIAAPDKPAKQVVRDIQSLAMARFGTNLDRRLISVVQITPEKVRPATPSRPAVVAVEDHMDGTRLGIEVTLRYADTDHVGRASGPATSSARLRLVGEATLDAVEHTFENAAPLALDAATAVPVGDRRIVVAVVVGAGRDGSEWVTAGSALVGQDEDHATVRAVLDALNRRLVDRRA